MATLIPVPAPAAPSPLLLCDRLIGLAQEADRGGYQVTAEHLLHLAYAVFDDSVDGRGRVTAPDARGAIARARPAPAFAARHQAARSA